MIQPLYYFPCIYSFADLLQQSTITFDLSSSFRRSSYRNRTIIAGAAGPITLSIPLEGGRSIKFAYKDVRIDYKSNWQRDHFRTLCTAYGNSAFFMFYKDELELLYQKKPSFLFEWNLQCLTWIFKKLKIELTNIDYQNQDISGLNHYAKDMYKPQSWGIDDQSLAVHYQQVFADKIGFLPNLSVLDILFNIGPASKEVLLNEIAKLR